MTTVNLFTVKNFDWWALLHNLKKQKTKPILKISRRLHTHSMVEMIAALFRPLRFRFSLLLNYYFFLPFNSPLKLPLLCAVLLIKHLFIVHLPAMSFPF